MFLCSRQIGSALTAADLVNDLKSVHDLRALVLPMGGQQHWEVATREPVGLGARGRWLAQAMPQLRTLLYIDPQMAIAAALGEEPWREATESIGQSLREADLGSLLVGRVVGDDLADRLESLLATGCEFVNRETGLPWRELGCPIHAMRVPLGAAPYVHAVTEGCRVILGGVVSAGAMTMGFLHSDERIDRRDWDSLAQLTLHAMLAERASLAIELTDAGVPALHYAPWTPGAPRAPGDTKLESHVRQHLEHWEVTIAPSMFHSPDVSFAVGTTDLQAGPYGGITLSPVAGGPAPQDLPVDIIYRAGCASTLVASLTDQGLLAELDLAARQLEGMFPLTQGPQGQEGIVVQSHGRPDESPMTQKLSVELFGGSESRVAEMHGKAYELLAKIPGCRFHTPELPDVRVAYQRWPTTVPRELVEWDVEIRAATDWA